MSKIVEEIHNIHYQCFYQGCNFKITNDHERFDKHLAKHILEKTISRLETQTQNFTQGKKNQYLKTLI